MYRLRTTLARLFVLLVLLVPLATTTSAATETTREFGDYVVHYIAVNSSFISPEVADRYDLTRGARQAFLNIAVLKKQPGGDNLPVTALVTGRKDNLMQQSMEIPFREVREGDAIYYLGEFEFSNAENLRFELEIQPEERGPAYPLSWNTRLYINQ